MSIILLHESLMCFWCFFFSSYWSS